MQMSVSEAKGKLTDLVRRAEAGDEIILTRHGQPRVRLTRIEGSVDTEALRNRRVAAMNRAIVAARERGPDGRPSAARSQDYLYGDDGLPA